jgi:hypothetical protein
VAARHSRTRSEPLAYVHPIVLKNIRESEVFKDELRRRRPSRKRPIEHEKTSDSALKNLRESEERHLKAERGVAASAPNGRAALREACLDCGGESVTYNPAETRCAGCAERAAPNPLAVTANTYTHVLAAETELAYGLLIPRGTD